MSCRRALRQEAQLLSPRSMRGLLGPGADDGGAPPGGGAPRRPRSRVAATGAPPRFSRATGSPSRPGPGIRRSRGCALGRAARRPRLRHGRAVGHSEASRPVREVYRLRPDTKVALQMYVEDRVLEGFWVARRRIIAELAGMGFDLVLTPNFSVWRAASRWDQIVQQRRSIPPAGQAGR